MEATAGADTQAQRDALKHLQEGHGLATSAMDLADAAHAAYRKAWATHDPVLREEARLQYEAAQMNVERGRESLRFDQWLVEIDRALSAERASERMAKAANEYARAMQRATWVLAGATVALALATFGLIWATLAA